jgi:putative Ca2+/H+ antiporter (TMEM165/GDT1 family)
MFRIGIHAKGVNRCNGAFFLLNLYTGAEKVEAYSEWRRGMDWKVFLTTFGILFLAELGDKTQLAVITMTTETAKPVGVFLGAATALCVVTLLGVIFGYVIQQWIPANVLKRVAALGFVVIGLIMFFGKF